MHLFSSYLSYTQFPWLHGHAHRLGPNRLGPNRLGLNRLGPNKLGTNRLKTITADPRGDFGAAHPTLTKMVHTLASTTLSYKEHLDREG